MGWKSLLLLSFSGWLYFLFQVFPELRDGLRSPGRAVGVKRVVKYEMKIGRANAKMTRKSLLLLLSEGLELSKVFLGYFDS